MRIFVSSPSDVHPERVRAEQIIEVLARQFAEAFPVEPVLWEWQPVTAGEHFQATITPPSGTDVVVVILWSRLGVPLPVERFKGKLSGGRVTGTEWEFEDALASYREHKTPRSSSTSSALPSRRRSRTPTIRGSMRSGRRSGG